VGQLLIKRVAVILLLTVCCFAQALEQQADAEHETHQAHNAGHSDHLLMLIHHKIALQALQKQQTSNPAVSTLALQGRHLRQVMPILKNYMATPKSYYLTTEMYHDSLDNRAAMLADFSTLLIEYQKQLVSPP
jgi:hypothetical protein